MHMITSHQIQTQPRFCILLFCFPPCLHIFVHNQCRLMSLFTPGGSHLCPVTEQIPPRICPWILFYIFYNIRPITVSLVAIEISHIIKACRPNAYSSFKYMILTNTHGCRMPPLTPAILHGRSMSGSRQEATRLIRKWIILC